MRRALPPNAGPFRRRLRGWYARHRRSLPWRRTRDPWAILVSEIMLQQTQVARVTEYWPRFLRRYPTASDLASARASAVRDAWDGLGYYARARNLHRAAKSMKTLPRTSEEWRAVPGVGAYTAAAIASIAHGERVEIGRASCRERV